MSHVSVVCELDQKIQRAKKGLFTGILAIGIESKPDADVEWFLYFLVGQIVWASAYTHPKRRWHRQCLKQASQLSPKIIHPRTCPPRNYKTLAQLVMHQKFDREQFADIVRGCIAEILFDILQAAALAAQTSDPTSAAKLIYKASPRQGANFPCIGLQPAHIWDRSQQDWQDWQRANLLNYCPNMAPAIVQPEILQERISANQFQDLKERADGQQTLRDLAVRTQQPLIALTQSLVPHIRRELIKLVHVDDLSPAVSSKHPFNSKLSFSFSSPSKCLSNGAGSSPGALDRSVQVAATHSPRIVYIDNNPADGQIMAGIFRGSGYRYTNISDPLQALTTVLALKPQLIFLNVVMPVINGYELCAQIRRVSAFENVPILIMTNNSITDRIRAKLVGANGVLGKPIQASQVLKTAIKYLQPVPMVQHSLS